ncbi:LysR substrate-binding domain-containing protein [Sphingomonas sp.]|uniref:LysR substrate-binding domain-containing protein n=1 Tax=Sphingomonas sp. TaxID=28214 RepID=UPI0031D83BDD
MTAAFPSLIAIRAFEAAARLGGFAPAARELQTTAAAVSYHVRQLETQLGVDLFRRHAQRVQLTPAGEVLAADALSAFTALRAGFARAIDADQSRLRVTALPTLGTVWLAPRLGRFRALHPELRVELDLSPDPRDLAGGGFDVAIRNGHGAWPGLRAVPLFPSVFTPLCAPALVERVQGLDDPAQQLRVPLLGRPDWWELWHRDLGHPAGPAPERFGTTFSAEHLDIAAAIAGHGVAIGSPILFAADIAAGRLARVHPHAATDGRAFWLAYPVTRQLSPKIAAFRDWVTSEIASA